MGLLFSFFSRSGPPKRKVPMSAGNETRSLSFSGVEAFFHFIPLRSSTISLFNICYAIVTYVWEKLGPRKQVRDMIFGFVSRASSTLYCSI